MKDSLLGWIALFILGLLVTAGEVFSRQFEHERQVQPEGEKASREILLP